MSCITVVLFSLLMAKLLVLVLGSVELVFDCVITDVSFVKRNADLFEGH